MVRYAGGDADAFDALYHRYDARIYGFCLRYLQNGDAAADAFQDVFRRVVDARSAYEPRGRFASWIFTIARRVCVDAVRAAAPTEPLQPAATAALDEVAVPADFEARLTRRDTLQRLLARLPAQQREALLLSKHYGFAYGEIAEMTGSTEAAVKQKVYRALQTLRSTPESLDQE